MAMSNAERQARYKARRKAEGLMQVTEWIVKGGGLARYENGAWAPMDRKGPKGRDEKAVILTVRLPESLRGRFLEACQAEDTTAAREIRAFIKEYLKSRQQPELSNPKKK
jgi:hypothetical protein